MLQQHLSICLVMTGSSLQRRPVFSPNRVYIRALVEKVLHNIWIAAT